MPCRLSIIVCTHNPSPPVFQRCIDSIQSALEPLEDAELIVVDNDSASPVQGIPLSASKPGFEPKYIKEDKRGLTPARLRGIRESKGDLLVFIDDDNFVRRDFFVQGLRIAEKHPFIGAFSGQVHLLFEKPPPDWSHPYHGLLVRRVFDTDRWSNLPHLDATMPCGAGLFVRRQAANHYSYLHDSKRREIQLDRTGDSLLSGGDNDLAACACDVGMGVGLFKELQLEHYIPESRLQKTYLLRLTRGIYCSSVVFKALRGDMPEAYSLRRKLLDRIRLLLMGPMKSAFFREQIRGEEEGRMLVGRLLNEREGR
jgi:glycosyltransferase involved in cell wall biosynthesis